MIVTKDELICFNSMLDGTNLFGTHFQAPPSCDEAFVQQTVAGLKEKGFFDAENQPNKLFFLAAKTLEKYKKANTHIFWNNTRLGLDEKHVVALTSVEGKFDITCTDKALYLLAMKQNLPALENTEDMPVLVEEMPMKKWTGDYGKGVVIEDYQAIQKIKDKRVSVDTIFLYRIKDTWHIYRPQKEELTTCGAPYVLECLLELFDLPASKTLKGEKQ